MSHTYKDAGRGNNLDKQKYRRENILPIKYHVKIRDEIVQYFQFNESREIQKKTYFYKYFFNLSFTRSLQSQHGHNSGK